MLDILSGGRLNFGVGRGLIPKHFGGFRVAPEESQARYEEALEIIQRAWTQERVSYDGQFWQIPEYHYYQYVFNRRRKIYEYRTYYQKNK